MDRVIWNNMSNESKEIDIQIAYDEEAEIWYVVNCNVPGVHVESESLGEIFSTLQVIVPKMALANWVTQKGEVK